MAYITNDGARLIERAKTEGKSLVFGAVRMNTIYKSDPSSLVQKSDEWYGANHGEVVGCLSHVSVDDVSCVCDSKLAVQCNDNSESWKTIGIYAHLDGEEGETLLACESLQNGEYKDVTLVELPVTLDGVVEDFGLSEGSGGGGGGDVPENMMTTNTVQTGLSGEKQWLWQIYEGSGTEDKPQEGDVNRFKILHIGGNVKEEDLPDPLVFNSTRHEFIDGAWHTSTSDQSIAVLDANGVYMNGINATWANIINAANRSVADMFARRHFVGDDGEGNPMVFGQTIQPDSNLSEDHMLWKFDSSGYLESVSANAFVATIGVIVSDQNGDMVANGRVSGFSMSEDTPLTFQSPIQLQIGYTITYQVILSSLS